MVALLVQLEPIVIHICGVVLAAAEPNSSLTITGEAELVSRWTKAKPLLPPPAAAPAATIFALVIVIWSPRNEPEPAVVGVIDVMTPDAPRTTVYLALEFAPPLPWTPVNVPLLPPL